MYGKIAPGRQVDVRSVVVVVVVVYNNNEKYE